MDSYYKSLKLAAGYTTKEIIKGKMSTVAVSLPDQGGRASTTPWPAPQLGRVALSVDGSFLKEDGSTAVGMVLRNDKGDVVVGLAAPIIELSTEVF